jgi:hypothetical protein
MTRNVTNISGKYLRLSEFGYCEEAVIVVDRGNLSSGMLEDVMVSPEVGIDCESGPSFNGHDVGKMETLQMALNYSKDEEEDKTVKVVYIFDVPNLIQSELFLTWMQRFCSGYTGLIVGIDVQSDL